MVEDRARDAGARGFVRTFAAGLTQYQYNAALVLTSKHAHSKKSGRQHADAVEQMERRKSLVEGAFLHRFWRKSTSATNTVEPGHSLSSQWTTL